MRIKKTISRDDFEYEHKILIEIVVRMNKIIIIKIIIILANIIIMNKIIMMNPNVNNN